MVDHGADAGVSPYFRLIGDYRISEKFSVYAEGTVRSLSKEIKDSPMVDGDIAYGFPTISKKWRGPSVPQAH